ncbi:MAG: O-antigen ligase family protein [Thermoleophilaceae bacterium]
MIAFVEQPTTLTRLAVNGATATLVAVLALAVAVEPRTAVVVAPVAVLAAAGWTLLERAQLDTRSLALPAAGLAAIPLIAVRPVLSLLVTLVAGGTALAMRGLGVSVPVPVWLRDHVREHPWSTLLAAIATVAVFAQWPATSTVLALVATTIVLARYAPAAGLAIAALMMAFEGSIKLLLTLEPTPVPVSARAFGAAAIDVALFASIAGVVIADGLRTPRLFWKRATGIERIVIALLGLWLAASVIQIAQGGDLSRGFAGFRLFQAYTLLALATAVAFTPRGTKPPPSARAVLLLAVPVTAYAAFRVVTGPSHAELEMARSFQTVTAYGGVVRAVGSFTSAVGMASFLTPLVPFGLVYGWLVPRARRLAWTVAVMAIVGIVGSYSRAALLGMALGLLCMLVVLVTTADVPLRRKLATAGLVAAILGATYGGVQAATQASPRLAERARGIIHPLRDKSVQLRFDNWGGRFDAIAHQPLGHGVGSAGAASLESTTDPRKRVITDNTFIKVVYEQGIPIGALFLAAVLASIVLLGRRLSGRSGDARALGLAALTGFVAFLGLAATGEYVEQPGKVVAWAFLGIAMAESFAPRRRRRESA